VILRNAFVSINGVDLSDHCREVSVDDGRAEHDDTVMSHTAESVEAGLPRWTITVRLRQNYGASGVHQTIRPLIGTVVPVVVRPDAGAVSATNEQITGNGLLSRYTPIGGAVGQPQEPTLEFRNAGTALAYATS
jgi:hypothetical protein